MKVIIEVDNLDELDKIKKFLKQENIEDFQIKTNQKLSLFDIFNNYNIELPKDFKFSREEANER